MLHAQKFPEEALDDLRFRNPLTRRNALVGRMKLEGIRRVPAQPEDLLNRRLRLAYRFRLFLAVGIAIQKIIRVLMEGGEFRDIRFFSHDVTSLKNASISLMAAGSRPISWTMAPSPTALRKATLSHTLA